MMTSARGERFPTMLCLPRIMNPRLCLLAWCLALLALVTSSAVAGVPAVRDAPEWARLVHLWHAMLDHSSDRIFSPKGLAELSPSLEKADADIGALWERDLLSKELAPRLRWLFHLRYEYIDQHHYPKQAQCSLTGLESAYVTARWWVERDFNSLRAPRISPPDSAERIRANLAYQLSFIYEYEEFEVEMEARRLALQRRAEQDETVDWASFESECQRRRNLLMEAYHGGRIRTADVIARLLPYALALNESTVPTPPKSAAVETSPI